MFCRHATRGIQAEPGEEDQHPQRCDARRAFSPHEQRIQDVQITTAEGGEVHL